MLPVACRSLSRIRDAVAGGVLAVVVLSAVTARGAASAPAPEPAPGPLPVAASAPRASAPPASSSTRVDDWSEDLAVVRDVFLPRDRSYQAPARRAALGRLEQLRGRLGELDDVEIAAELARIAALSANAHTRVYLLRNRGHWRRYPLRLWRFDDGWRVVAAQGAAETLLGGRVTHVAGRPVEEVFAALRPLFAGNESWARYMGSYTLTSADALHAAALVDLGGSAEFRVEAQGGVTSLIVAPSAFERREGAEESWWYLSPARANGPAWRYAIAAAPLPDWLAGAAADYRFARCAGDVIYVQFNRAVDTPGGETIAAWGARLLAEIERRPPRRLLFDLRFNTGGDLTRARPLVEALAASALGSVPGGLVVLSGESTFSAGITPLAVLRGTSRAIVVGRRPGDGTDFWAEGGNLVLPHSRLVVHYADGLHSYSGRARAAGLEQHIDLGLEVADLEPDLPVRSTWRDYASGRDADVEAVLGAPLRCGDAAAAGR